MIGFTLSTCIGLVLLASGISSLQLDDSNVSISAEDPVDPRAGSAAIQHNLSSDCYEAATGKGDPAICTAVLQLSDLDSMTRSAALNNRAILLSRRQQFNLALSDLNEAAALDPGSPAIAVNQGNLLLRLDRFQDAIGAYNAAIRIAGITYAPALYNRSFAYRAMGDLVSAEMDLAAAAKQPGGLLERMPEQRIHTIAPDGSARQ